MSDENKEELEPEPAPAGDGASPPRRPPVITTLLDPEDPDDPDKRKETPIPKGMPCSYGNGNCVSTMRVHLCNRSNFLWRRRRMSRLQIDVCD